MIKVGQKVRVKSREYCCHNFKYFNDSGMRHYCEKEAIVVRKTQYPKHECESFFLNISGENGFFWFEDCLEPIYSTMELE